LGILVSLTKEKKMQVTLRKGAALSAALIEQARKLPLTKLVTLSIHQKETPQDTIASAQTRLTENVVEAGRLFDAAYALRAVIGAANAANGIDDLLAEKAALDAREKLVTGVLGGGKNIDYDYEQGTDAEIAAAQLESLKARQTADRYAGDTVAVKILSADIAKNLEEELANLRRRKVEIADLLLTKNMTTTVEVPAAAETLLNQYKLV
jgi:vacuolar-type H+-ATPase subunit F/Vma7